MFRLTLLICATEHNRIIHQCPCGDLNERKNHHELLLIPSGTWLDCFGFFTPASWFGADCVDRSALNHHVDVSLIESATSSVQLVSSISHAAGHCCGGGLARSLTRHLLTHRSAEYDDDEAGERSVVMQAPLLNYFSRFVCAECMSAKSINSTKRLEHGAAAASAPNQWSGRQTTDMDLPLHVVHTGRQPCPTIRFSSIINKLITLADRYVVANSSIQQQQHRPRRQL